LKDLLEHRFQIEDSDDLSTVRRKLERGLGEGGGNQELSPVQAQIIGRWLGFDLQDELEVQVSSAEELNNRAMLYLDDYFKRLATGEPLVILLEDIHWAGNSSLDAVDELARRLRRQPLLITGAARPQPFERHPQWGEGYGTHRRISLRPLSKRFSRQLVAEVLQRVEGTPDRLRQLIIDRAEGNPFFVEELIKMLLEDGVIVKEEPSWRVQEDRLAKVKVPETLTAVLQARLDSLSAREREVMQRSSVVGRVLPQRVGDLSFRFRLYSLNSAEHRRSYHSAGRESNVLQKFSPIHHILL
jgi:predicted ATPase